MKSPKISLNYLLILAFLMLIASKLKFSEKLSKISKEDGKFYKKKKIKKASQNPIPQHHINNHNKKIIIINYIQNLMTLYPNSSSKPKPKDSLNKNSKHSSKKNLSKAKISISILFISLTLIIIPPKIFHKIPNQIISPKII